MTQNEQKSNLLVAISLKRGYFFLRDCWRGDIPNHLRDILSFGDLRCNIFTKKVVFTLNGNRRLEIQIIILQISTLGSVFQTARLHFDLPSS